MPWLKASKELMNKTVDKRNQPFHAAGRLWTIPRMTLSVLPDGTLALSQAAIDRIHRAIANAVCGNARPLSAAELELLCDVTEATFSDVANHLELAKSAVSRWRSRGRRVPRAHSLLLKKWFWFKLFGTQLGDEDVPLRLAADEASLLDHAMHEAIDKKLTDRVSEATAA